MSLLALAREEPSFPGALQRAGLPPLTRGRVTTLQINVGKVCNQACHHCHVDAGPQRTEAMGEAVARALVTLLDRSPGIETVDITGGAPELNPNFRWLVDEALARGRAVMARHNLTVLFERGQEDLADFYAQRCVHLVCSLPCYTRDNVDKQRGKGVFGRSIEALQALNARGYGDPASGRRLDLVYNPGGAFLPPEQARLEADYKARLREDFDVAFDRLFTITNMPISRFADQLRRRGELDTYMSLIVDGFNAGTVGGLMCRDTLSVDWEGRLFDCDFNQMLELPAGAPEHRTVFELASADDLTGAPIAVDTHCFGCTAGAGSSCGGALDA